MSETATTERRAVRAVPEREMAIALCLEFVETGCVRFSLFDFYDDDSDFLDGLADRLNVPRHAPAFKNKLRRVVRRLVNYGVLHSSMRATARDYVDEPSKQRSYWLRPDKCGLLRDGPNETRGIHEPEWEAGFLLRHAYPEDEST